MKGSLIRKRIAFDGATWHILQQLSLDTGKRLQDLAKEAFSDLLKKHRRPITLRDALREASACIRPTITTPGCIGVDTRRGHP